MKNLLALILVMGLLTACNRHQDPDRWQGKWPGVEGTFLAIGIQGDNAEINIQNLDGLKTYQGKKFDDHIEFTRKNVTEMIVFGDGKATGMKWFADKKKCLVIKSGEGFCRK